MRRARLTFTIKIPPLLLLLALLILRPRSILRWSLRENAEEKRKGDKKKGGRKERKKGRERNKIGKRKVERIAVAAKRSVSLVRVCLINLVSPEYFSS